MEDIQGLYIQRTLTPRELGRLLLTSSASKNNDFQTTIYIYENALVENSKKKQTIKFDYDLKFSFTLSPAQFNFERGTEKVAFRLKSENDVHAWRLLLKSKLNQRGFHQQFTPKKKIGKGNFATVYLAEKKQDGKEYAVKAFCKEAAYSEDNGKQCLIKEIEIMRSLDHRNCMKLHQIFESDNSLYIVVQLLSGGQLYQKVKNKYKFRSNQVRTVMQSILYGLKQMHNKNAMHRDLKPENIIMKKEGSFECVIADFGLSQFADAEEYLFVRCGTPGYVAPEVINIKDMKMKYQTICDMFSLGLIFHLIYLGVSAFPGKTYNQVLAQNRASDFNFEGEKYQKMRKNDPEAFELMTKMLKKNPKERITSIEALSHPYFSETMQEEEEDEEQRDCIGQMTSKSNYPNCQSPLLTTQNKDRKVIKKDSCLQLVMGKENVFTGKTDTVGDMGSGVNNSVAKRFESVLIPKSKFNKK